MTIPAQAVDTDLHQCEVPTEGGGKLTFLGRKLGHASTHEAGKLRWFEIAIYWNDERTSYVVSKIGRSIVYHRPNCGSLKIPVDARMTVKDPPDGWIACPVCEPDTDFAPVVLEQDRVTCHPDLIVLEVPEVLRQRDEESGEWFLSNAARTALREATDNDEELMRVYAPRRARRVSDS